VISERGKVALRYGPMIYNVELADQANIGQPIASAQLVAEWRPDLLRCRRDQRQVARRHGTHRDVRSLVWMATES